MSKLSSLFTEEEFKDLTQSVEMQLDSYQKVAYFGNKEFQDKVVRISKLLGKLDEMWST